MRAHPYPLPTLLLGALLGVSAPAQAQAQEARSVAQTRELVELLEAQKLDAVAAKLGDEEFAAILYIPGVQILAVSARYGAPSLLDDKIARRTYRDVYLDLASASIPESKVFIEDMNADGLRPDRSGSDPFDLYTKGTAASVMFDGDYRDRGLDEAAYQNAFQAAEAAYERMLSALIEELRKPI
jgi:hypothetical protein